MNPIVIGVEGSTDRLLVAGLHELAPVLRKLGSGATVIGGLMVRIWLHAMPVDFPARPTPDIDLGIDKKTLRITGTKRVVAPLLEDQLFTAGYGGEPFRYSKDVEAGAIIVDVVVAPGASRSEPPLVESGLETVSAPGLAYTQLRKPVLLDVRFVDGDETSDFRLHLPRLDAAFVLKAALAQSGVRTRYDRIRSDAVDSVLLAAACVNHPPSIAALKANRSRGDVRKAVRWISEAFRSPTAIGARRVARHVRDQGAGNGGGEWGYRISQELQRALASSAGEAGKTHAEQR